MLTQPQSVFEFQHFKTVKIIVMEQHSVSVPHGHPLKFKDALAHKQGALALVSILQFRFLITSLT